jgi:hypothetical protein
MFPDMIPIYMMFNQSLSSPHCLSSFHTPSGKELDTARILLASVEMPSPWFNSYLHVANETTTLLAAKII